jgi:hypothetical protein
MPTHHRRTAEIASEEDRTRLQEAVRRLDVIANVRSTFPVVQEFQRSRRIISERSLSMEQGDGMHFVDLCSPPSSPLRTINKRSMSMEGDGMDDDEVLSRLSASPIIQNSPVPTKANIRLSRRRIIMDGMMVSSGRSQRTMHDSDSSDSRYQRLSNLGMSFKDLDMHF